MTANDPAAGTALDTARDASTAQRSDLRASFKPTLVLVCGRPGSGKTTLARQLASALPCPLVSRDEINEGIYHTFHHDLSVASKATVTAMAYDAFFAMIKHLLSAQASVIAEAAFQDAKWRDGLASIDAYSIAVLIVVQCVIDPVHARERVLDRRSRLDTPASRRAAQARTEEEGGTDQGFQAVSLPAPTLAVATTHSYEPGLDQVLEFIRGGTIEGC